MKRTDICVSAYVLGINMDTFSIEDVNVILESFGAIFSNLGYNSTQLLIEKKTDVYLGIRGI